MFVFNDEQYGANAKEYGKKINMLPPEEVGHLRVDNDNIMLCIGRAATRRLYFSFADGWPTGQRFAKLFVPVCLLEAAVSWTDHALRTA